MRKMAELPLVLLTVVATLLLLSPSPKEERLVRDHLDRQRGQVRYPLPDDGAGRYADSPTEIPPRGWWQIVKRVFKGINDHRVLTEAGAITFYALLSLFPALAALVAVFGLVANPQEISSQLSQLEGFVPSGGMDLIRSQLDSLVAHSNSTLGWTLALSLATSLWTANSAMKAMFDSLNIVYDETEKRSYVRLTLLSMAMTLGALGFTILAVIGVVAVPVVLNFIGLGSFTDVLLRLARWPVLMVVITFLLAAVYRYGPSRDRARWRWVTPGGIVAAVLWVIVSVLFSWYVAHFGSYNKTYGSLGAAVGFMTWLWLSATVVLVGAELDAEMEHQTARDSTEGGPRPMGQRGATKADTVAL